MRRNNKFLINIFHQTSLLAERGKEEGGAKDTLSTLFFHRRVSILVVYFRRLFSTVSRASRADFAPRRIKFDDGHPIYLRARIIKRINVSLGAFMRTTRAGERERERRRGSGDGLLFPSRSGQVLPMMHLRCTPPVTGTYIPEQFSAGQARKTINVSLRSIAAIRTAEKRRLPHIDTDIIGLPLRIVLSRYVLLIVYRSQEHSCNAESSACWLTLILRS